MISTPFSLNTRALRRSSLFGILLGMAFSAQADVKLASIFSDHMVLQRNQALPVWGTADDGEEVSVSFRGKTVKTTASQGKWMVKLPKQKAGGPDELTVKGKNTLTLKDVLVGEVWVCSGQSNMEWPLQASYQPQSDIESATNSMIRLFTVPKKQVAEPTDVIPSQWVLSSPASARSFSAVGYYFGRDLQEALKVPIGLINTSWGGSPAEGWMSQDAIQKNPIYAEKITTHWEGRWKKFENDLAKYKEEEAKLKAEGKKIERRAPGSPNFKPSHLYNGMIHPLIPFAIKGAIWYQGESNADRAHQYRVLFPDMITNWRQKWGQGDFTFLAVQLAPFDHGRKRPLEQITAAPGESTWAELREAQWLATKAIPNVGVAVITDVGDKDDIHPNKKKPVGQRLALLARKMAYEEKIDAISPSVKNVTMKGNKAILTFDNVGGGLVARDGELTGFSMAGKDGKFVWGTAKIINKNTVEVSSEAVSEPVSVRYGWADFPVVNLWTKEGIPATPFRTDDFPMTTKPNS